jgi:catecholate siderophore receptor
MFFVSHIGSVFASHAAIATTVSYAVMTWAMAGSISTARAQGAPAANLPAVTIAPPAQRQRAIAPVQAPRARVTATRVVRRAAPVRVRQRVIASRAPLTAPAVVAPQPPVVNSQDARSGTVGYTVQRITTGTKTNTPLINIPQSVTVLTKQVIQDQAATSMGEAVRYVPGVIFHQGEGNRDDLVIRGQRSNADFFVNGIRDDVQYYRDFYNLQRLEVLKGPNALIFGRGGGGGIVNRVLKEADGTTVREFTLGGNSYPGGRAQIDLGQAVSDTVAVRLNGFYENSDNYRNFFNMKRYGINPTMTWAPNAATSFKLSYEYYNDWRVTDRGIPSQNNPAGFPPPAYAYPTSPSTYFGAPGQGYAKTEVHMVTGVLNHDFGNGLSLRNATQFASYDKFYQNVFPGSAVNAAGTTLNLTAYNNENDRKNIFNQTDLTYKFGTGAINHTVVAGAEFGQQTGLSFRQTGYFNNVFAQTTLPVSPLNPITYGPVTFSNRAADANSKYRLNLAAVYVQDQIEINRHLQFVAGVRFDSFDLASTDRRTLVTNGRVDNVFSPRVGMIVKPMDNLSIYASYSVSHLPSGGDQFSALTPGLIVAKPEKFENTELGIKYDYSQRLQFTAAVYNLDRFNQRLPDPNNAGFFILSGKTKTRGFEAGVNGYITDEWQVAGGYAYTDARIDSDVSATIKQGNRVGLVPLNTFSLWNRYQINQMFGVGLGLIHQTDFYANSDNAVKLRGFSRVDAAVFFRLNDMWRAQLNVENIFDTKYIITADGNNNLTPGSPRAARFSLTAKF